MGSIIKFSNLTDLKPIKSSWRVQVKVLHTWKSSNPQLGSSLQMVLTDENGDKIHAICKESLLQQLESHCRVGEWKVITNFLLRPASGLYRPTNHVYQMEFVSLTSITDSQLQCDNIFLELQDFSNIKSGSLDTCFLIDVIGEVMDFGGLDIVQCARKEVTKVEFTLRDIKDQRIKCCIWGKLAEILTQEVKAPNKGDICLIRFAKIGNYKGELQVSNAFDYSLVLINPDIKEAEALKQMCHGGDYSLCMYQPNTNKILIQPKKDQILIQEKPLKWSQYPFRTIQEMKRTIKDGNCRVICKVYAVDTITGWYFLSCVLCNNQVFKMTVSFNEPYVPHWWCEFCQRIVTKVSPRYKLELLVQDQTGELKFTLLDTVATFLVNKSAAKLINHALYEIEANQMLPPEIVDIVGKTYGFGISCDEVEKYNAVKVWNLKDIMWKRIKSLHQASTTYPRKKQCIAMAEIENMDNDESINKKSG